MNLHLKNGRITIKHMNFLILIRLLEKWSIPYFKQTNPFIHHVSKEVFIFKYSRGDTETFPKVLFDRWNQTIYVVGKYVLGSSSDCPDYMTTSITDVKFGIKSFRFGSKLSMDGCLCFKDEFQY